MDHAPKPLILSFTKWSRNHQSFEDHDHSPQLCWSGCNWWGVTGKSYEVTRGHNPIFANSSRWDGDRVARMVPKDCSSSRFARYAYWLTWGITWPWPGLTWGQTWNLPFKAKIHVNQLDKANTMVSFSLAYLLYQKIVNENHYPYFFISWPKAKTVDPRPNLIKNLTGERRELIS